MIYNINGGFEQNPFSKNAHHIRVMSFNVGGWHYGEGSNVPASEETAYLEFHRGIIERNKPDIIGFQEYWDIFSKTGKTAVSFLEEYYPYIHAENGTDTYMGRCICSKYPITNYQVHNYSNEVARYYDEATVNVNGVEITVVNTHHSVDTNEHRIVQVVELTNFLKNKSLFISTGDYNVGFNTASTRNNRGSYGYINYIKPYLDAGFNLANHHDFGVLSTSSAIPDSDWNGCSDNIIVSSDILITNAYVDPCKRTDEINDRIDHMPIIADLQIYGPTLLFGTDEDPWSE